MGLLQRLVGAMVPASPIAPPRASAEYMRGQRASVYRSWHPFLRDARDDVRQAYWFSAARAIEMMHNSGWLAGLVRQAKASIVGGTGLQLVPEPDAVALGWSQDYADDWAEAVKPRFNAWASNPLECDIAGKWTLHQQVKSGIGSYFGFGEIVQYMRWVSRPESQTRTKVQFVPAHRLTQESNGIDLYQGVRVDKNGMPVGYRLRLPHPLLETGEIREIAARGQASRPIMVHTFEGDIGQMRGISPFAPVLGRLREFDHLTGGTLAAELARALIAATITSEKPTAEVMQIFESPEEQGVGGSIDGYMEARSDFYDGTSFDLGGDVKIAHLFPGEKLDLKTGGGTASVYDPLAQMLLRETAICAGFTIEEMTGDYSKTGSYSAVRMSTSNRWPMVVDRRVHIAAPCYQASFRCWLEEDIDRGLTPFPGGLDAFVANRDAACRASWRGSPKPQADDMKFAKSNETLKRVGVLTDERLCGEMGEDWEAVYRQLAREKARRKKLGLPEVVYSGSTVIDQDEIDEEATPPGNGGGQPAEKGK